MSDQSIEEQVNSFCEFSGCEDLNIARAAVKSGASIEALLDQWLEDPQVFTSRYAPRWDETAFAAGRDGESNNIGISFNVDGPDTDVIQGVTPPPGSSYWPGSAAPSRPPSRANNVSPLGSMGNNQADSDLERALQLSRESAAESGIQIHAEDAVAQAGSYNGELMGAGGSQQESGVTNGNYTGGAHFGPANRDTYEESNWAMVPTGTNATKAVPTEPAPSARKRENGAPAFLVQKPDQWSTSATRLGGILTIYHEIPLVRNILLQTGTQATSYGHSPEWWKGEKIYPPHIMAKLQEGTPEWSEEIKPDWREEVHRLMAFLDSTERCYGSIDPLTSFIGTGSVPAADTQFFDNLLQQTDPAILQPLLHEASSLMTKTLEVSESADKFAYLEFELTKNQWEGAKTFYDVWDWLAWELALNWQEVNENTRMTVMDKMGEVLTIKIDGDNPKDGPALEIPEVWYPERYLEVRKEEGRQIQEQLAWVASALYKSMDLERRYGTWKDPATNKLWTRAELAADLDIWQSIEKWYNFRETYKTEEGIPGDVLELIQGMDLQPMFMDDEKDVQSAVKLRVSRTKAVLSKLDGKLAKLSAETDKIKSYKEYLRGLLTDPEKAGPAGPFKGKRFLLRGVITAMNVVYVCKRSEPNLIELEDSAAEPVDQWWRLAYAPHESEAVSAKQVSFEHIQREMFNETRNPSLVYATEAALDGIAPLPLADPLQRFIKADNKTFRAELARERAEGEVQTDVMAATDGTHGAHMSPISPTKRKYRSNSNDSMASNRASMGNSAANSMMGDYADVMRDFEGQSGPLGTEMVDMQPGKNSDHGNPGHPNGTDTTTYFDLTKAATFPKVEEQVVEISPPQRSTYMEAQRNSPVEMRERRGNSPFLGARSGSTSSETRQAESYTLDLDSDMTEQGDTGKKQDLS